MRRVGKYTKQRKVRGAWFATNKYILWFHNLKRWQKIAIIVGPILTLMILIPLLTYFYFARDISDKERLMNRNNTGIVLTATNGEVIYQSGRAKHREMVPLDQISDTTKQALLASEDKDFYKHDGFSVLSTMRAVYGYVLGGGGGFGGSTLTQQLAKITVLSSERSAMRQFQAFSVALAIENTYTKDEILEMYLNSAFFGGNAFGIEDAAKSFFNKSPKDLTLAESAMIIGVLPAPNVYSPIYGDMKYAKERQATVLSRMVKNEYITQAEKDAAIAQELAFAEPESTVDESPAPHFVEMVLADMTERYGAEEVARAGYQVKTTLDLDIQNKLKTSINQNMAAIRASGGSNAAGIVTDPKTGAIRALMGSYDWDDEKDGKVNMVTALRQPGSSFKPIYFAAALADGTITPATILEDRAIDVNGWKPQNALRTFNGDVTVRKALNWSLNIPAVKVMQRYGVEKSIEAANDMGIDTIKKDGEYGLALALGAAEARLEDMTYAYAAFANEGRQESRAVVEEVRSRYDETVYKKKQQEKQVISAEGAYLISNILSDNQARAGMFGASLNLYGNKKAAVKTGTTDDNRDAWTIGYTPSWTVGIWVGNNDNTAMSSGGGTLAGPIWRGIMNEITTDANDQFTVPSGVTQRDVCYGTGKLANTSGTNTYKEYFLSTALPGYGCNVQQKEQKEEKPPEEEQPTTTPTQPTTPLPTEPPEDEEDEDDDTSTPTTPTDPEAEDGSGSGGTGGTGGTGTGGTGSGSGSNSGNNR